jgi:diacylglycerol kinase family enzyme
MVEGPSLGGPSLLRRAAAAAALLAFALAVATVVVGFIRRPILLLVVVPALLAAVLAGWIALVSRGPRRWVAAAIALALLVGVLAIVGLKTLAGAAAVLVLLVVCNLAAQIAFRQEQARVSGTATGQRVPSARRGVLLMNPRSGGGKVARFQLLEEARRRGVESVVLHPGDDLRTLAEQAVAEGADVIGMAGGDGSQAIVADVASRHDVAFVCVPAGTRNHFALDLGLDRDNVRAALEAFGEAIERRVDLAAVADRVFVNNASLGLYAAIVQSDAYRGAKLSTAIDMLPELMGPDSPDFDLHFGSPGGERPESADVLLVSNNPYAVRKLSGRGSRPRLDSGLLGVVAFHANRPRDFAALAAIHAGGALSPSQALRQWTASSFRVDSSQPVPVGLDGEALRLDPPLEFRALPGALRVRLPLAAPGVSRTPVYGLRETLLALWSIVAARPA